MIMDIHISDQDLPLLSAVATQALDLLQNPDVTNKKIDELIRQDMSLTERVMRTANSPFYGARIQSATIADAIFRLGLRQLHNVLVLAATGELFKDPDPIIQALWDHAMVTAMTAQTLADTFEIDHRQEAFIAGMLHDVGILIIYRQHPEPYLELMREAKLTGRKLHEIEAERIQYFTHMSVGGLVIRKWNLSDAVAEAARFHHELEKNVPGDIKFKGLSCVVSLADSLMTQLSSPLGEVDWEKLESLASAQFLKLNRARLEPVMPRIQGLIEINI